MGLGFPSWHLGPWSAFEGLGDVQDGKGLPWMAAPRQPGQKAEAGGGGPWACPARYLAGVRVQLTTQTPLTAVSQVARGSRDASSPQEPCFLLRNMINKSRE